LVRLKYIVALTDPGDILYALTEALMWTTVEAGIGITAASIATMRPLFRNCSILGFSSTGSRSYTRQTPRHVYHQSYDLGYIENGRIETQTTKHVRTLSDVNTSQENILRHGSEGKGAISKRMDFVVTYEGINEVPHGL
jgi:hypothetical protein